MESIADAVRRPRICIAAVVGGISGGMQAESLCYAGGYVPCDTCGKVCTTRHTYGRIIINMCNWCYRLRGVSVRYASVNIALNELKVLKQTLPVIRTAAMRSLIRLLFFERLCPGAAYDLGCDICLAPIARQYYVRAAPQSLHVCGDCIGRARVVASQCIPLACLGLCAIGSMPLLDTRTIVLGFFTQLLV